MSGILPNAWVSARKHSSFAWITACAAAAGLLASAATAAYAVTPESPEVKQVAEKGVKFLETATYGQWETHPGVRALVGMCILKRYGAQAKTHPKVVEALNFIRLAIKDNKIPHEEQIYNIGMCLIFLLDMELEGAGECRPEMEALLNMLLAAQKPHGGFGYPDRPTGDTSMTQYGALGMWSCQIAGFAVPVEHWERLANWLLRTQDPTGAYAYQGTDPGGFKRVPQPGVRPSLSAAGLGSLTISADALRLFAPKPKAPSGPAQLKRRTKPWEPLSKNVDSQRVTEALDLGERWFAANYTPEYHNQEEHWSPYYMYAFERYKSFLAVISKGKQDNKWYDDGYNHLAKTQSKDGSWPCSFFSMTTPNTAFAVLFLYRSTQRIIQHAQTFGGGLLVGGRGLPENASEVELRPDGIRAKPLKGPAIDLLQKMASPNDPKFEEAVRGMEEQSLVDAGDQLTDVQKQLRKLAEGKSPERRAAALRLLGRTRNLNNAPLLIESLRDNDPQIFLAATEALRFMSRKFTRAGQFGGENADPRQEAVRYWKDWYRGIRPDARFDDE